MTVPVKSSTDLRLAELVAALSLATDLGMRQSLEQALRTCLIALRLARLWGLASDELLRSITEQCFGFSAAQQTPTRRLV